jgi:hypothetical protein
MNWSPGFGLTDPQVLTQVFMPGACSHGLVLEVPLFASLPLAAM